jgi:hypothetical protein
MSQDSTPSTFSTASQAVQTSSLAIVSLVSGIASWFLLPILGAIIAVVTGHLAKKEIHESGGRLSGEEMANAGLVLGYLHLVVSVIVGCLILVIVAALIIFFFSAVQWSSASIRVIP